jgi:hypothetical protein
MMPEQRSQDLSPRRRIGIVGTNTRQRLRLIGLPPSLHCNSAGPTGLVRISAPHPSPAITGGPHVAMARLHLSLEWDGTRERTCF